MNVPIIKKSGIVDVIFGSNVVLIEPLNLYGCIIGDNCHIGPFVEIQRDVRIGNDCKIQSHTFICELVTIGDFCFIGHGVTFINDLFSESGPQFERTKWGHTNVGNHVSIGSNATLLPVSIVDGVIIGAGAVVTKDLTEPGIYAGNPARLIRRLDNSNP